MKIATYESGGDSQPDALDVRQAGEDSWPDSLDAKAAQ